MNKPVNIFTASTHHSATIKIIIGILSSVFQEATVNIHSSTEDIKDSKDSNETEDIKKVEEEPIKKKKHKKHSKNICNEKIEVFDKNISQEQNKELEKNDSVIDNLIKKKKNKAKEDKTVPNENGYIKIVAVDPTGTIMVYLRLKGSGFKPFICKKPRITIGQNFNNLEALFKNMNKNDELTFKIDDSLQCMEINMTNPKGDRIIELKSKRVELPESKIPRKSFDYPVSVTMKSSEFHRLCRNLSTWSKAVDIICTSTSISFRCKNETNDFKTEYKVRNDGDSDSDSISINWNKGYKHDIVQGRFDLSQLTLFTKCNSLCDYVNIYLKNDFLMTINYTIESLGVMRVVFSPQTTMHELHEEYYNKKEIKIKAEK